MNKKRKAAVNCQIKGIKYTLNVVDERLEVIKSSGLAISDPMDDIFKAQSRQLRHILEHLQCELKQRHWWQIFS